MIKKITCTFSFPTSTTHNVSANCARTLLASWQWEDMAVYIRREYPLVEEELSMELQRGWWAATVTGRLSLRRKFWNFQFSIKHDIDTVLMEFLAGGQVVFAVLGRQSLSALECSINRLLITPCSLLRILDRTGITGVLNLFSKNDVLRNAYTCNHGGAQDD